MASSFCLSTTAKKVYPGAKRQGSPRCTACPFGTNSKAEGTGQKKKAAAPALIPHPVERAAHISNLPFPELPPSHLTIEGE